MTKRQWAIVQIALFALQDNPDHPWDEEDGEPPSAEEIDQLVHELSLEQKGM